MKLKEIKTNAIKERLENFKKKRVNEKLEGDLPLDNKITIEMPVLIATALKDMDKNKEKNEEDLKEINKASEDFVKETEKQFKEAEKKAKAFKESYLEENFKDKWLKENNSYSVKCKGRKELRALIQECKDTNTRYKFDKLTEGEDKYIVRFKLDEQVKLKEDWITNYERGLEMINNGVKQCLVALCFRDGQKDRIDDVEEAMEQSFKTNIEDEINDFYTQLDFSDEPYKESLNEERYSVFTNDKSKKDGSDLKSMYDTYDDLETAKKQATQVNKDYQTKVSVEDESGNQVFVAEEKEEDKDLNESLELMGDINDYTPWGDAVAIYNEIVNADKLSSLDKLLNDIYQDGVSLKQLNDFLSNYPDFIRSMLDLDGVEEPVQEPTNDVVEPENVEEPTQEEPQEPKSQYLNDETGYGEDDEDTGDDDTEGLEDFLDKVAEEE